MTASKRQAKEIQEREAWFASICHEVVVPNLEPIRDRTQIAVGEAWLAREDRVAPPVEAVARMRTQVGDVLAVAVEQQAKRRPMTCRFLWVASVSAAAVVAVAWIGLMLEPQKAETWTLLDTFEEAVSQPTDGAYAWLDEDIANMELDLAGGQTDVVPLGGDYDDLLDDIDDYLTDHSGFEDWS